VEALTVQNNEKAEEIADLWKNVTETQTALEKSKQDFADALRVYGQEMQQLLDCPQLIGVYAQSELTGTQEEL
jgi:hypothetical protein